MKIMFNRSAHRSEVRVFDEQGLTTRKFTYGNLARRAADTWSSAYGDCPDQTEGQKP